MLAEGPRGSLTKEIVATVEARRHESAGLRHRHQGIVGRSAGPHQAGIRGAHAGLAARFTSIYGGGWIYGLRDNRVSIGMVIGLEYHDPLFRSARSVSEIQDASVRPQILEGGKLVRYGAKTVPYGGWYSMPRHLCGWRPDHRRFRQPAEFAAAERNSHRDQERNARRRNDFRSACVGRHVRATLAAFSAKDRRKAGSKKNCGAFGIFIRDFITASSAACSSAGCQFVTGGRGLIDPMHSARRLRGLSQAESRARARRSIHAIQGRWQAHVRPPHRRLSFRHAP